MTICLNYQAKDQNPYDTPSPIHDKSDQTRLDMRPLQSEDTDMAFSKPPPPPPKIGDNKVSPRYASEKGRYSHGERALKRGHSSYGFESSKDDFGSRKVARYERGPRVTIANDDWDEGRWSGPKISAREAESAARVAIAKDDWPMRIANEEAVKAAERTLRTEKQRAYTAQKFSRLGFYLANLIFSLLRTMIKILQHSLRLLLNVNVNKLK